MFASQLYLTGPWWYQVGVGGNTDNGAGWGGWGQKISYKNTLKLVLKQHGLARDFWEMAGTATLCVHKSDRTEVLSFGKTFYETYKVKNHDNNGLGGYTESNYYLLWEKFMQKNMSY